MDKPDFEHDVRHWEGRASNQKDQKNIKLNLNASLEASPLA